MRKGGKCIILYENIFVVNVFVVHEYTTLESYWFVFPISETQSLTQHTQGSR